MREVTDYGVVTEGRAGDDVTAQGWFGVRGLAGRGVVVGANGSGKSTFARVVAGVDRPDAAPARDSRRAHGAAAEA